MAILWEKKLNGTHYEVRTAGRSRRLYTDGVFHSQYHPERAYAGGVWDLLMLPAFFYAPKKIQRVLVLGVGGGAVIHQIKRHIKPKYIVGVELNPVHLYVAKRYFALDKHVAQLHQADAISWLENYQGPPFDMIIEDLFGEQEGEPVRVIAPDVAWFKLLARHLTPHGQLVMNFLSKESLRECAWFHHAASHKKFSHAFMFTLKLYDNAIAAFLKAPPIAHGLRDSVLKQPGLGSAVKNKKLQYRMRVLKAGM